MASQGAPAKPKSYSVGELKSRILNIAQTSVYLVKLQPPSDVVSFLQSQGSFSYTTQGEDFELLCSDAQLPGSSLASHDVTNDYQGVTEKMAYRRIYDNTIDFTFYVDKNYNVNEFFEGWMNYVTGEGTTLPRSKYKEETVYYRMNYPDKYKTSIYITKFEKDSSNALYYTFVGAFPITIVSTPISYSESQLLKMNVSFSYMRYVRERVQLSANVVKPDPRSPEANSNLQQQNPQNTQNLSPVYRRGINGSPTRVEQN